MTRERITEKAVRYWPIVVSILSIFAAIVSAWTLMGAKATALTGDVDRLRARVAKVESVQGVDEAKYAIDHDALHEVLDDVRWLVCDKDPKQCRTR